MSFEGLEEFLVAHPRLDAGQDGRLGCSPEDVPCFGLAVRLTVFTLGRFVIGMEVNGELVGGVEELEEQGEVWSLPTAADQFFG